MIYEIDSPLNYIGQTFYGDTIGSSSNKWRTFVKIKAATETGGGMSVTYEMGFEIVSGRCNSTAWHYRGSQYEEEGKWSWDLKDGNPYTDGTWGDSFLKTTVPHTEYISEAYSNTGSNSYNGESYVSIRFPLVGKDCGTLTYNGNDVRATNIPASQTIQSNTPFPVPNQIPTIDEFNTFSHWNTLSDGSGSSYYIGDTMSFSANQTLYSQWINNGYPPTAEVSDPTPTSCTQYVDEISVDVSDVVIWETALSATATLYVGTTSNSETIAGDVTTVSVAPDEYGELPVYVDIVDNDGRSTRITKGTVTVKQAKWQASLLVDFSSEVPPVNYALPEETPSGKAICKISAKNTTNNTYEEIPNTSGWEYEILSPNKWRVYCTVGEDYVDDKYSDNPDIDLKVEYDSVQRFEKPYRQAFYNSSRTANYQSGFANLVFVSGSNTVDYASRVWYSQYNNPTYFPDLNYVEVGSNDTQVMGLVKIKEYLGVIKQSKTVDTAIYLLYPTTFEEDWTFAVKQGINGIGAIAKYAFNVLGDETLFLSPEGVMAIEPNEDESHKTKNRSYYINKKLLAEEDLSSAYSFVYDGKYFLAVNSHCYVLDGNQKTSWETARTNLQYEAYYWENVPAICFVRYANSLWFTDGENLCRFSKDGEEDAYNDDGEPIVGIWSTIFDDDGSIHYFKNLRKKGNVVSILPCGGKTSADIYVKVDDKEEVKIGTIESELNRPADFYLNKKFKKYKRMQIIVKNEEINQGFGVDSIIKNYTIGNYSKNRGV